MISTSIGLRPRIPNSGVMAHPLQAIKVSQVWFQRGRTAMPGTVSRTLCYDSIAVPSSARQSERLPSAPGRGPGESGSLPAQRPRQVVLEPGQPLLEFPNPFTEGTGHLGQAVAEQEQS